MRLRIIAAAVMWVAASVVCAADIPDVSQEGLLQSIKSTDAPLVLDVRTPEEYKQGHVPGAVNIPHTEVAARLAELGDKKDRSMVLYCEKGGRAAKAADVLSKQGFTNLKHLTGDMSAWRDKDLPTEK